MICNTFIPNTFRIRNTMKYFLISLVFLTVASCTSIFFSEPQPVNGKIFKTFPRQVQGVWLYEGEKDTVAITETSVNIHGIDTTCYKKSSLDSNYRYFVKNGFLYIVESNDTLVSKLIAQGKDTICTVEYEEESYQLSDSIIMKKISRNAYIINSMNAKNRWELILLEVNKEGLQFRYLSDNAVDLINDISNEIHIDTLYNTTSDDSDLNLLSKYDLFIEKGMTKREFKRLIKQGGFGNTLFELDNKYRIE
jgi:hypothetical protein